MQYRSDIDGLRAVAVLLITGFHINEFRLPGGFIGVDVFFVISGFLITNIIVRDIEAGRFDIWDFYARRARRLFPALFVMLGVTTVVATLLMLPPELVTYGKSLLASVLYYSNFHFLGQSGYFDHALSESPLLHTWSLSVEEQFYLVFPALLLLLFRFGRLQRLAGLLALGIGTLALGAWLTEAAPAVAFYISPTRFWEFVCGALIAVVPIPRMKGWFPHLLTAGGLLAIIAPAFLINKEWPFPGLTAAIPVLATAAAIVGGGMAPNWGTRLLSLPPVTAIGRISYSVYLWHWPLIVFYRIAFASQFTLVDQAILLAGSLALGTLSYWLIERPTRRRGFLENKRQIAGASAVGVAAFAVFGLSATLSGGLPDRFSPEAQRIATFLTFTGETPNMDDRCFVPSILELKKFDPAICVRPSASGKAVAIIGDSYAGQYAKAMVDSFPDYTVSQITAAGCRPVIGGEGEPQCLEIMRRAYEEFVPSGMFDTVIVIGRWRGVDGERLANTVRHIARHARMVIVFGPAVEYRLALPRLLAIAAQTGSQAGVDAARELDRMRALADVVESAVEEGGGVFFSVLDAMCPGNVCTTVREGAPVQHDFGHLTREGAMMVLGELKDRNLLLD